ncbi:MAG: pyruvate kinase, partial [Deltaproteobacteria bacterium]|nr:pyruvate kinase [Deltaproteobacteria bacterium]
RRPPGRLEELRKLCDASPPATAAEAIASVVEHALGKVPFAAVFVPTRSGSTARMISRFKPKVWIVASTPHPAVCRGLLFSYGVHPVEADPERWRDFAEDWVREHGVPGRFAILVAGPSPRNPDADHRIEFLRIGVGTEDRS